jgi:hypothetical protein
MIEIKPIFGGWREVDKNKAKDFVTFLIQNCQAVHPKHINEYINSNKLRGITVEELLKDNN